MKGHSLKYSTMRQMIEDVWDKCKEKNIDILCEVSDGQWIHNINHDIHGEPLSRLQFQKKNLERNYGHEESGINSVFE